MNRDLVVCLALSAVIAGCHRTASSRTPGGTMATALIDPLVSATRIEIVEEWGGVVCSHRFEAVLVPRGDSYEGEGTLIMLPGPRQTRTATVPRAVIAALQAKAEPYRAIGWPELPPFDLRNGWTDDYPSGAMTFTGPAGEHRIGYVDQRRLLTWQHDGKTVALDIDDNIRRAPPGMKPWPEYRRVLEPFDLENWVGEACKP